MERIPIAGPSITQKEADYVLDALKNGWYAKHYAFNARFEEQFAEYIGRKYAISLPSCTSALHLSLMAAGVGPGDEVVVPDITWIASAAPITYVGATPVFADVEEDTWCLSPEAFEAAVTPRTKAVIPVDLYGNMPRLPEIQEVAERHGLALIEDAAEGVGSELDGRMAGSFGLTGTFSFHGSKTMTTGEGGMLVLDDEETWKRCLFLRDHGRPAGDRMFHNTEVAYKYKMSSLQAALGLAQLERIDELIARKRQIYSWYHDRLDGVTGLTLNHERPGEKNSYWMITVIVDESFGMDKTALMEALWERQIDSRPFFHPLSSLPAYAHLGQMEACRERNPVSYRISPRAVNLPSGYDLTREKVDYVCTQLLEVLE